MAAPMFAIYNSGKVSPHQKKKFRMVVRIINEKTGSDDVRFLDEGQIVEVGKFTYKNIGDKLYRKKTKSKNGEYALCDGNS